MTAPLNDLDALLPWASDHQKQIIADLDRLGSANAVARERGCHHSSISKSVQRLRVRAAMAGFSPKHDMTRSVPEPFVVKGVSTYYDSEGKARGQWVKSRLSDDAFQEAIREAVAALSADIPRAAPVLAPEAAASKLCNLFTVTDYHVGMLSWGKESGDDWDLRIAEDTLTKAFDHLVAASPRARVAVVNQLGDFLHQDSIEAVTPTSRHLLDADGRFRKVIGVAVRILRRLIDAALATHDEVHLIMAEGNHDISSSAWLQAMFAALYENEPRLTVNDSMLPYYAYQHGKTMLGFHHGHMKRNDGLPLHFAASYPEMWGQTTKRYVHVGHRHHVEEKEHSGVKVVQHSTLSARDAYAARGGWHSDRQALAITYHEDHGEVARATVTPGMLQP